MQKRYRLRKIYPAPSADGKNSTGNQILPDLVVTSSVCCISVQSSVPQFGCCRQKWKKCKNSTKRFYIQKSFLQSWAIIGDKDDQILKFWVKMIFILQILDFFKNFVFNFLDIYDFWNYKKIRVIISCVGGKFWRRDVWTETLQANQ